MWLFYRIGYKTNRRNNFKCKFKV